MSVTPPVHRFWPKVQVSGSDCWEWRGRRDRGGYGRFDIDRTTSIGAHRFAYMVSNGPIPEGLFVCHACDNPGCVNPAHLWVGTSGDNTRDAKVKGRLSEPPDVRKYGVENAAARLTPKDVEEIRYTYAAGGTTYEHLGSAYGVGQSTIYKIVRGLTWPHVGGPVLSVDQRAFNGSGGDSLRPRVEIRVTPHERTAA